MTGLPQPAQVNNVEIWLQDAKYKMIFLSVAVPSAMIQTAMPYAWRPAARRMQNIRRHATNRICAIISNSVLNISDALTRAGNTARDHLGTPYMEIRDRTRPEIRLSV